jgi:hypothetical protein
MKKIRYTSLVIIFITFGLISQAASITSAATGNWNSTASWAGGVIPGAADIVTIAATHTITLTANAAATSITVSAGAFLNTATFQILNATALNLTGTITIGHANGLNNGGAGAMPAVAAVTVNTPSVVVFNGAVTQQIDARTYWNVTLNNNAATKVAAGNITLSGVLTIATGVTFDKGTNSVSFTGTGAFSGTGVISSTGGIFSHAGGGTLGTLYMAPAPNNVFGSISITNNGAPKTLSLGTPLLVTTAFANNSCIITTTSTNILQYTGTASMGGAGTTSYINGPVDITTSSTTAIAIPIGHNVIPATVTITPSSAASTVFRVQYTNGSVPNTGSINTTQLNSVYANNYWQINRSSGTANATLAFSIGQAPTGSVVTEIMTIANYSAGSWSSLPVTTLVRGGSAGGNPTTAAVQTSFGDYCVGSVIKRLSVASGLWSNASTWAGGILPTANTVAEIVNGHTVTLGTSAPALAAIVQVGATLDLTSNQLTSAFAGLVDSGNVAIANANAGGVTTLALPSTAAARIVFPVSTSTVTYYGGTSQALWNLAHQNVIISNSAAIKTLATAFVMTGNLQIDNGCILDKGAQSLTVSGNITGAGVINSSGSSISIVGTTGVANLKMGTVTGTALIVNRTGMGTAGSVVMVSPAAFTTVTLTKGIIQSDSVNFITISTSYGGSTGLTSDTYFNGPVAYTSASTGAFILPLGKNNLIAALTITPSAATGTVWTLQYFNQTPANKTSLGTSIIGIDSNEYWSIKRDNNTVNANLTLAFKVSQGNATSGSTLRMVKYGTTWDAVPLTDNSIVSTTTAGSIITSAPVTLNVSANTQDLFGVGFAATPANIVSITSGNWNSGATWNTGQVPALGDRATILTGHTVTVSANITSAASPGAITVNTGGRLNIAAAISIANNAPTGTIIDNVTDQQPQLAYGMRKLLAFYPGFCMTIRRSSDNTTLNVGFDANGNLDTAAIKTFVTTNSAFVTTWYDQTGNGRNLIQATNANQPRIVNAGVIDRKDNGAPAIRHIAANTHFLSVNNGYTVSTLAMTATAVQGLDVAGGTTNMIYLQDANVPLGIRTTTEDYFSYSGAAMAGGGVRATTTTNHVYAVVFGGGGGYMDGTLIGATTAAWAIASGLVRTAQTATSGTIQELIVWNSNFNNTDRMLVENSQKNYYKNNQLSTGASGILVNGTLGIAHGNVGLTGAFVGTLPTFGAGSTVEYNGAAQTVTGGVIRANLVMAGTGLKTLASDLICYSNLTINSGVTFTKAALNLTFRLGLVNNGTFNSTAGTLTIQGTTAINLDFEATGKTLTNLVLNTTAGVTLTQPLIVSGGTITFTNGLLTTTAVNTLTLTNSITAGGTITSYINGPVLLSTTNTISRILMTGKSGVLAPVTIIPKDASAVTYAAEYFRGAGVTPDNANITGVITGVGTNQYWSITRPSGTTDVKIVLSYITANGSSGSHLNIAAYGASGPWTGYNVRANMVLANTLSGTVTSSDYQSVFGNFALGYRPLIVETGLDSLGLNSAITANFALGLRRLRTIYTGPAIKVRRSTDDVEQDFGFTVNGDLDTASIKTFIGASTGFVSAWYDQSVNGRMFDQTGTMHNSITNNMQPVIITAGVVNRLNGKPTINFDGSNDGMRAQYVQASQAGTTGSFFYVQKTTSDIFYYGPGSSVAFGLAARQSTVTASTSMVTSLAAYWMDGVIQGWSGSTTQGDVYTALNNKTSLISAVNTVIAWNNGNPIIGAVEAMAGNLATAASSFGGDMPEVVSLNTTITLPQQISLENSLANYYSIATPNNAWISTSAGGNWSDPATWIQGTMPPNNAGIQIATTGGNTVVLDTNVNISAMMVNAGASLDLGATKQLTVLSQVTNNGTLITANANGLTGSTASIIGTCNLSNTSTVIYNGVASIIVTPAIYQNLTISNAAKNLNGITTVNGVLTLNANLFLASIVLTLNGTIAGTASLSGNATGTLTIGGITGGSLGTLKMLNSIGTLTINRTGSNATVTLGSTLTVNTMATFTSGVLNTDSTNLLILNSISTTGGSNNSYINGPARIISATAAIKSVALGKSGFYGNISLTPSVATTTWKAVFISSIFKHLSKLEYS